MICLRIKNPYIRQARIINPSQREGVEPKEVESSLPGGARLRIHGAEHAGAGLQRCWNSEGEGKHSHDKPRL